MFGWIRKLFKLKSSKPQAPAQGFKPDVPVQQVHPEPRIRIMAKCRDSGGFGRAWGLASLRRHFGKGKKP